MIGRNNKSGPCSLPPTALIVPSIPHDSPPFSHDKPLCWLAPSSLEECRRREEMLPAPLSHLPGLDPPWIPLKRAGTRQNSSWRLSQAFDSMESEKQKCEQFPETRVLGTGSAVLTSGTRTRGVQAWGSQQKPNAWPCLQSSSHFFLGKLRWS